MLSLTRTVQSLTLKLKLFEKGRREFQCGKYCNSFEVEALQVVQHAIIGSLTREGMLKKA
jgi:hypothetical protein